MERSSIVKLHFGHLLLLRGSTVDVSVYGFGP